MNENIHRVRQLLNRTYVTRLDVFFFSLFLLMPWSAVAYSLTGSIPQCQEWVRETPSLYHTCLAYRRHFGGSSKTRGGEEQKYGDNSAWFFPSLSYGHFFVGCSFSEGDNPTYIGIYYALDTSSIAYANVAPLISVDFNGDAAISINGKITTFLPVRPFYSMNIKSKWPRNGIDCNDPRNSQGYIDPLAQGPLKVDFSEFESKNVLTIDYGSKTPKEIVYRKLIGKSFGINEEALWHEIDNSVIITTSGSLYIAVDRMKFLCSIGNVKLRMKSTLFLNQICIIM